MFTDEEVITLFLFGIMNKHREIKTIYDEAHRHLGDGFPKLPSYPGFVQRVNKVGDVFAPLVEILSARGPVLGDWLLDFQPIILAQQGHSFNARVAPEYASRGYCASKKLYYYGVKLHVLGQQQIGSLPFPDYIGITPASENDGKVLENFLPYLPENRAYGDKAYEYLKPIAAAQGIELLTPIKRLKGQEYLDGADQWLSRAVSQVRQPIESFFNWINEKTGNKRPRSKLRGIGLPKNAASCGEWTRRDSKSE
ncbi:transposase [Candidatus Competibacter denitrificans]|uniref:transposase n=1 Tax=Candidatus Competibacter denitrificans TaxID=1400862 RepID=UPI001F5B4CD6|nr:transposase [Candidatus Competibacter denitrificans]